MINPFSAIKAYFAVSSTTKEIYKEATTMNGSKPGWKTTEFWGKVGMQVMTLWGAVSGFVPPKWAIIIGTSLEAVYAVCRTVSKAVSDVQTARVEAPAATVTATATASEK